MPWHRLRYLYSSSLYRYPLVGNMCLAFGIGCGGDIACYYLERFIDKSASRNWDWKRTCKIGGIRTVFVAPVLVYWYPFLARKFPGGHMRAVLARVAADQLLWAPTFVVGFYGVKAVIEGKSPVEMIRSKFWHTMLVNWAIWPAAQFVNFKVVPLQSYILFTNCVSVLWNGALSYIAHANEHPHATHPEVAAGVLLDGEADGPAGREDTSDSA